MVHFFSIEYPLYILLLNAFIFAAVLYFFVSKIMQPLREQHKIEKSVLESKNQQLLCLFTTFSPNPVFRFDEQGTIVLTNTAGEEIAGADIIGMDIRKLLPAISELNITEVFHNHEELKRDCTLNGRDFSITVKGITELNCGHVYCYDITERKKNELDLQNTRLKLQELAMHISDLREQDRTTLGMELHDNITQTLALVRMMGNEFSRLHFANDEGFAQHLKLKGIIDNLITETKELSYSLKPKHLKDLGLVPAAENLIRQISTKEKIEGHFFHYGLENLIPPKIELHIFRIIQELVSNIIQHSGATKFVVQIFNSEDSIKILVQDNGRGFDSNALKKSVGLGLVNIRERVDSFEGSCEFETSADKGTEFIIQLPHRVVYGKTS